MTQEQKARDMKALTAYPEWQTFIVHIREVAQAHCDSSVTFSCKGNALDAQRQAWISEGLVEAIEEPESVMQEHEYEKKSIVRKASEIVGKIFSK